jgi:hypothetical protein
MLQYAYGNTQYTEPLEVTGKLHLYLWLIDKKYMNVYEEQR